MKWYYEYAVKAGIAVSGNHELVADLDDGLEHNKGKMGARHCPCVPPYLFDKTKPVTVCPCKPMRDEIAAGTFKACHCGLFVVRGEDECNGCEAKEKQG